jgi:hypothetical protein
MCYKKHTHISRLLEITSIIVWDEAPINNRCCFKALDRSLRDALSGCVSCHHSLPFKGKTILFGSDFSQILPVIPEGTQDEIIHASLINSSLWPKFTIITLKENMHLSFDKLSSNERFEITPFAKWIISIGNNDLHDLPCSDECDASFLKISSSILLHASIDPITTIVSTIYQCVG